MKKKMKKRRRGLFPCNNFGKSQFGSRVHILNFLSHFFEKKKKKRVQRANKLFSILRKPVQFNIEEGGSGKPIKFFLTSEPSNNKVVKAISFI